MPKYVTQTKSTSCLLAALKKASKSLKHTPFSMVHSNKSITISYMIFTSKSIRIEFHWHVNDDSVATSWPLSFITSGLNRFFFFINWESACLDNANGKIEKHTTQNTFNNMSLSRRSLIIFSPFFFFVDFFSVICFLENRIRHDWTTHKFHILSIFCLNFVCFVW